MSGDLSNSSLNEGHDQTLKSIQELQDMEKKLYRQLESSSANKGDATSEERIIKRINELSEMRTGLFKSLTDKYNLLQNSVAETRVDLVDQMTVVGIVENELNNAKANLNSIQNAKNDKMRMVEINTYYGQRYQAHTGVMKLVIMTCVPLLLLAILNKKQLIPSNISKGLATIVIIIGAILIIQRILDLNGRDNMNYDEINWQFNPDAVKPTVYEYDRQQLEGTQIESEIRDEAQNLAANIGLGCIGESCCSKDMTYDNKSNKCIENKTKDGFQILGNDIVFPWGKNSSIIQSFSQDSDNYASV
jgi:hypothetical protein